MALNIRQLTPVFAAEITGVDLRAPLDDETFATIRDAFHTHAVLAFPDQHLDDDQQTKFSERFGALERSIAETISANPVVYHLANVDDEGALLKPDDPKRMILEGNKAWHTDSSFKVVPAMVSLLSAREVPPEGGETEYADMRAAYDALDDNKKRDLEDAIGLHSFAYSQGQLGTGALTGDELDALPPVEHPMIRTHPANGRKALYIGRHASHIVGRLVEESRTLLGELLAFATQPQFTYRHEWRVGDLVMWDNRSVLHRGRPWDESRYRRVMHRTTVAGEAADNPWRVDAAAE